MMRDSQKTHQVMATTAAQAFLKVLYGIISEKIKVHQGLDENTKIRFAWELDEKNLGYRKYPDDLVSGRNPWEASITVPLVYDIFRRLFELGYDPRNKSGYLNYLKSLSGHGSKYGSEYWGDLVKYKFKVRKLSNNKFQVSEKASGDWFHSNNLKHLALVNTLKAALKEFKD